MKTITCFGDRDKRHFPYNCLGLSEEKKTYQREKNLSYCMAGKVENKKIEEYENGNNYLLW